MNAIPNIVYEIYVAIDAFFTEPEPGSMLPTPRMTFELGKLLKPVPGNLKLDLIFQAVLLLRSFSDFLAFFLALECEDQ